ncbi:MAG: SEC-C metal-binding domain-containing protein, partial [Caldimonas sp.]
AEHISNVTYTHPNDDGSVSQESATSAAADAALGAVAAGMSMVRDSSVPKVGRNDPCPCGSGKKYKQCHGKLA